MIHNFHELLTNLYVDTISGKFLFKLLLPRFFAQFAFSESVLASNQGKIVMYSYHKDKKKKCAYPRNHIKKF